MTEIELNYKSLLAILEIICAQLALTHLTKKITHKLFTYKSFIFNQLTMCKQKIALELLVSRSNSWNH